MKVLILFALASMAVAYDAPTQDEIWTAINAAQDVFTGDSEMIGMAIRLSFHDCVGGCNGAINPDDHENAGLSVVVEKLEAKYQDGIKDTMSRADFWVLAAYAGVDKGIVGSNRDCPRVNRVKTYCEVDAMDFTFQWGREDADSDSPYCDTIDGIPPVDLQTAEVYAFFESEFGMDVEDTVAIMGAHNIGGTHPEYTGFLGNWLTCSIRQWNNRYYEVMLEPVEEINWLQRDRSEGDDPYYQWMGFNVSTDSRQSIMLPTDWAMAYVNEVTEGTYWMNCEVQNGLTADEGKCADSDGKPYVEHFAENYDDWMVSFRAAFEQMVSNGCEDCPTALEIIPTEQK